MDIHLTVQRTQRAVGHRQRTAHGAKGSLAPVPASAPQDVPGAVGRVRSARFALVVTMALALVAVLSGCGREAPRVSDPAERAGPPFDEARAYADIVRQAGFGPRVPGTEAHRRGQDYIQRELKRAGWTVRRQPVTRSKTAAVLPPMANILAELPAPKRAEATGAPDPAAATPPGVEASGGVRGTWLLVAHYDSRPVADREPLLARRSLPVPGANDGASGVAVLLEIARQLAARPGAYDQAVLAFVDGEDWPNQGLPNPSGVALLGSRRLAPWAARQRFIGSLVIDMVGDRDLLLRPESYSLESSSGLVDTVWAAGQQEDPVVFDPTPNGAVVDDHLPLANAGVPSCVLIDLDYPSWHTLRDTPDKTSAASLGTVGRTVLGVLLARPASREGGRAR